MFGLGLDLWQRKWLGFGGGAGGGGAGASILVPLASTHTAGFAPTVRAPSHEVSVPLASTVTAAFVPTQVGPPPTVLAPSYVASVSDLTNVASYTSTGQNIGTAAADRVVYVLAIGEISDNTTVAADIACTIGGNAASVGVRHVRIVGGGGANGVYIAIFYLLVTTGTTADIVVSFNGKTQNNCHISTYKSTGSATIAVTDTIAVNTNTDSITVGAGGFYIAGGINTVFTAISWSAGPPSADFASWTGEHYVLGGHDNASETVTASGGSVLVAASFEAA